MGITCGIDWTEIHHDIALADEKGRIIGRARIDTRVIGFNELLGLIAENGGTPEDTPIAIETDTNLLVVALADAGFTVYPINPRAVARYRERHGKGRRQIGPRRRRDPGEHPANRP
ncbi:IS110 family transposase [Rhodococcus opacus]|uniref:IS110 family transposase n=1 Tax=Rhodococcus opacus TaxID=37919 RepID=UPI00241255BC|nr:transposase [Rhodococcus opacus]